MSDEVRARSISALSYRHRKYLTNRLHGSASYRRFTVGGIGNSGMGKYHGEWVFRAYTNARGV